MSYALHINYQHFLIENCQWKRQKSISTIIQGVIEMRDQILTTNYWFHVELGKNNFMSKFYVKKSNDIYFLSYNFF
jgi:hypothetical protein